MKDRRRARSIFLWDGGLPLIVVSSSAWLRLAVSHRDLANFTSIIFVPLASALFRAHLGWYQFAKLGLRPTLGRQALLGCGVVLLMLVEAGASGLMLEREASPAAWLSVAAFYSIYLAFVAAAFRPVVRTSAKKGGPIDDDFA